MEGVLRENCPPPEDLREIVPEMYKMARLAFRDLARNPEVPVAEGQVIGGSVGMSYRRGEGNLGYAHVECGPLRMDFEDADLTRQDYSLTNLVLRLPAPYAEGNWRSIGKIIARNVPKARPVEGNLVVRKRSVLRFLADVGLRRLDEEETKYARYEVSEDGTSVSVRFYPSADIGEQQAARIAQEIHDIGGEAGRAARKFPFLGGRERPA